MGTRGYIGITSGNLFRGAYNHLDSYPDGLGSDAVNFALWADQNPEKAREIARLPIVEGQDKPSDKTLDQLKAGGFWQNVDQGDNYYAALRNCQGDFRKYLSAGMIIADESPFGSFMEDSLFCEFAYLVDLDSKTLDFYVGLQTESPSDGLFKGAQKPQDWQPEYEGEKYYYPVNRLASIPFSELSDLNSVIAKMNELAYLDDEE